MLAAINWFHSPLVEGLEAAAANSGFSISDH
jgi:hypothetical protein